MQPQQWTFENTFASVPIRPPHSAPSPAATPTSARVPAPVRDHTTWTAQEEGVLINLMIDKWRDIRDCTYPRQIKGHWLSLTDALNITRGVEGPKPMSAVKRKWAALKTQYMNITDQIENQTGIGGGPGNERWAHYDSMARIVGRDSTIIPPVVIDSMAERFVRVKRRDDADSDDDNVDEPEQDDEQEQQQEQRGQQQEGGRRQRQRTAYEQFGQRHEAMLDVVRNMVGVIEGLRDTLERSIEADRVESERLRQEDNRRHSEFLAVLSSFCAESNTTSTSNDNDSTTS
ncbi:hypothetical protein BC941DRAFT_445830, partial [Chlamydoabsidia padenii]